MERVLIFGNYPPPFEISMVTWCRVVIQQLWTTFFSRIFYTYMCKYVYTCWPVYLASYATQ